MAEDVGRLSAKRFKFSDRGMVEPREALEQTIEVNGQPIRVIGVMPPRVVVGEGVALVGAGGAIGPVISLGVSSALRSLLYEVAATDSVVYGTVTAVIVVVAAIACYVPARRAATSDPLLALRAE